MKFSVLRTFLVSLFLFPSILFAQDNSIAAILGYPDLIIYNGNIVTMDDPGFNSDTGTIAQAMAVRNDTILAIGNNQDIRRLAGPDTKQYDLKQRTVLPGFILTHEHPHDWAWSEPTALNHVFPEGNEHLVIHFMKGGAEAQLANWEDAVRQAVSKAKPGQWVLVSSDWGGNYENQAELWTKFILPITTKKMDELAPNNPLRIKNSFPNGLVNTLGLKKAQEVFPEADAVGYRNRGITGRMLEPDVILYHKPELNAELLNAVFEIWNAFGVTGFSSGAYSTGNLEALHILDREGRMSARFGWSYTGPDLHYQTIRLVSALLGSGTDYLWNIGAHGERSAATCTTIPASERVKAQERCTLEPGQEGRREKEDIVRSGGRIASMHSSADKDIDNLLDVIETQSKAAGLTLEQIRERRHAFDHAMGAPRPDQIPRIKRLGMMVSMLNTLLWENSIGLDASYRLMNYGEEYLHYSVPRNSVVKSGVMATQEIDRPLPHFLFYNLWVGMTRYNAGLDRTLAPEEGTDLVTQLKGLTSWGAYYLLKENKLGSLERGKLADFVVLDKDILSIPTDDLPQVKVLMTVLGGKTVHLMPGLADELNTNAVGAVTWPSKPLETRFVFKGPPPVPEYMKEVMKNTTMAVQE